MTSRVNLLLLVALLGSCLYLVRVSYDSRRLYAELDRERGTAAKLATEHQRLEAERQGQATHLRVEKVARDKLAMRPAGPAVTQYVVDAPSAAATEVR